MLDRELVGQGWLANPDNCQAKRMFADRIDFWFPVRSSGLIYSDGYSGGAVTLRYVRLTGGQWPTTVMPTTIQSNVSQVYGLIGSAREYVMYNVLDGSPQQGLYIAGPFGFAP
jgi:hypothetical protein